MADSTTNQKRDTIFDGSFYILKNGEPKEVLRYLAEHNFGILRWTVFVGSEEKLVSAPRYIESSLRNPR